MGAIFDLGNGGKLVLNSCKFENIEGSIVHAGEDSNIDVKSTSFHNIKQSPDEIFKQLIGRIDNSRLDKSTKNRLVRDIVLFTTHKASNQEAIKNKLLTLIGSAAKDCFVQLAAAVSSGFILRII